MYKESISLRRVKETLFFINKLNPKVNQSKEMKKKKKKKKKEKEEVKNLCRQGI